eukprot:CAMPEP_0198245150 /NCGR_PEP_ID=MMETSP1446-20131203/39480_1 /TAXON_ID=1461542 ORGANISM="Unidentified sp, Strain CCMP2111" /NCGR_SAMPLE_ID=MMETSP1446 /ASSEMBLY_ACC=CAM_ASM_001112 /LENGTH=60 /DNA_ID=CAMNT_0043929289 /DNA_START=15 /DNA_END=197 /DNA_ORIENTATION=+
MAAISRSMSVWGLPMALATPEVDEICSTPLAWRFGNSSVRASLFAFTTLCHLLTSLELSA